MASILEVPAWPGLTGEVIHSMDGRIVYRVRHGAGFLQTEVPRSLVVSGSMSDISEYLTKWEVSAFGKEIPEEEKGINLDDLAEVEPEVKEVTFGRWEIK